VASISWQAVLFDFRLTALRKTKPSIWCIHRRGLLSSSMSSFQSLKLPSSLRYRLFIQRTTSARLKAHQHLRFPMHNRSSSLSPSVRNHSKKQEILTWWLGKIRVSATTTFSLRPAVKTTISAMSSGVNGSQPLYATVNLSSIGEGAGGLTRIPHPPLLYPHKT
jgi:hypothetical protein